MSWNYRVFKRTFTTIHGSEDFYTIHEAYYKKGRKKPHLISVDAMEPHGNTLEELKADLELFKKALDKPVLDYNTREEITPEK